MEVNIRTIKLWCFLVIGLFSTTASALPPSWGSQAIFTQLNGVATMEFSKINNNGSSFSGVDFNPVFLARYQDLFLFRGAVDFSINMQGDTDTSLDFANINWFMNDYMVFGFGKADSSVGQFVQNLSPDWINKLTSAPVGFDGDQAAPQSEIGINLRGGLPLICGMRSNYVFYMIGGPRAMVDVNNNIIDHINTDGFTGGNTSNYVLGGRIGFLPVSQVEIGVSFAVGKAGLYDMNDSSVLSQRGRDYNVWGVDFYAQWLGFNLRGEIVQQELQAQDFSISPETNRWRAWYFQVAYRLPDTNFEPAVRYSEYIAQLNDMSQRQLAFGLDYWFTPSIVAKFGYEINDGLYGTENNANALFLQLVFGF